MNADDVAARLAEVRGRIAAAAARADRPAEAVTLVAVVKTLDAPTVAAAIAAGVHDLGENRAQELAAHTAALGPTEPAATPLRWHFIGRLQSNKVRALAPVVGLWHSIDRPELGGVIARHAPGARVLVQVNVGEEPQKGGCAPADTGAIVDALRADGLTVEGLMTVPPAAQEPRPHFARLRAIAADLGLATLSMGMSGDFEIAIEEGATIVRVGSAIFGPRPTPGVLRR